MCDVRGLLFWKNTVSTASAIGVFNTALVLIFLCGWSALRLLCYTLMFVMVIGLVLSFLFSKDEVKNLYQEHSAGSQVIEFFAREDAEDAAVNMCDLANNYANRIYSLVLWNDTSASVRAMCVLSILSFVFRVFPFWFLLLAVVNGAFTYTFCTDQDEAKGHISHLHILADVFFNQTDSLVSSVYNKIPRMEHVKQQ